MPHSSDVDVPDAGFTFRPSLIFLLVCLAAFIVPTVLGVAHASWATDQGAHGPIVLAIAIWLIARQHKAVRRLARPGSGLLGGIVLVPSLVVVVFARITGIIEVEAIAAYVAMLAVAYCFIGRRALLHLWFPVLFLLFIVPPPDTLYAMLTQPLKIAISEWSVNILYALGYPVASSGVVLLIGQYQLLVAAACSGINSLISLTAVGLLYSYIRHGSSVVQMSILILFAVPIAVVANLVRVLLLLLITYHFGEASGQGWFHEFAGMSMYFVALLIIYVVDETTGAIRRRFANGKAA